MAEHRMIRSSALAMAALAAAVSVPSSNALTLPTPRASPLPDVKRRQARPSKFERESKRSPRRYHPKDGNSAVDNARREKAEAKRQRKARAHKDMAQ